MRVALGVEYDGRAFHGWQTQRAGVRTVQAVLEAALSAVADHPVRLHCAGRTDAGVHAWGQVAHFDTRATRTGRQWLLGANSALPGDVSLHWACDVPDGFHARYSATGRTYRYLILNRQTRSGLLGGRVTWVHRPLAIEPMRSAASSLIGTHDFSSYRAQGCQANSPVRTVHRLELTRRDDLICIDVSADGFLHHMVRNIAGVLIAIGRGDADPHWAVELLVKRDRALGGVTAPPDGLYFQSASYPPEFEIPEPPAAVFR